MDVRKHWRHLVKRMGYRIEQLNYQTRLIITLLIAGGVTRVTLNPLLFSFGIQQINTVFPQQRYFCPKFCLKTWIKLNWIHSILAFWTKYQKLILYHFPLKHSLVFNENPVSLSLRGRLFPLGRELRAAFNCVGGRSS